MRGDGSPPSPSGQSVLVTGAAGVIGPHLVRALVEQGRHVIAVDDFSSGSRHNTETWHGDARIELLEHDIIEPLEIDREIDQIYHLACPASPAHYQRDPVRTLLTSVRGSVNVLELARAHDATVLLASTSEVYGDPLEHPQRESYWGNVNPVGERSCYDEGKRCAESLFVNYRRQYGVLTRIARIFNTYGPGMRDDDGRVISSLIVSALAGGPLQVFGDGRQTRSFCYVDDLVRGLMALMAESPSRADPVNLGNPEELSMLELADAVGRALGKAVEVDHRPLPADDPRRRRPDIREAELRLGWRPTTSLEEGLRRTAEYFRDRA